MKTDGPITLNFTRLVIYPERKVYTFTCPQCNWRFDYAIGDDAIMLRCRHCKRMFSVLELRLLIFKPLEDTRHTLGDLAAASAAEAARQLIADRDRLNQDVHYPTEGEPRGA